MCNSCHTPYKKKKLKQKDKKKEKANENKNPPLCCNLIVS